MQHIAQGHTAAFDILYQRYSGRLLRYFYRMLNGDEEKAQDFLQELCLKLVEKPHLYDPDRRFSSWVFAIASNMVKNEYRRLEVRSVMTQLDDLSKLPVGEWMDEGAIDREAFRQELEQALNHLSEKHREVFLLRYQEELSIREISEITTCSEGTVKSRLFYALRNLASRMEVFDPKKEES